MKYVFTKYFLWFLIIGNGSAFLHTLNAQFKDSLHITLDMTLPIQQGWLDPTTEKVGLRGDLFPLSWGRTMYASDLSGNGIYHLSLGYEVTDSLEISYKIKVDGDGNPDDGWQKGRNHLVKMYHGKDQHISIAWEEEAPPPPPTLTGEIDELRMVKGSYLLPHDIFVYLPPNYKQSTDRYPVLYMHDGQPLFDKSAVGQEWKMDETAQALILADKIEPVIIVGIGNNQNRIEEYTPSKYRWEKHYERIASKESIEDLGKYIGSFQTADHDTMIVLNRGDSLYVLFSGYETPQKLRKRKNSSTFFFDERSGITLKFEALEQKKFSKIRATKRAMGGDGDHYAKFILYTLKPYIDSTYRTKSGPEFTAIGGSSLGGLISLYIGVNYSDVFGHILAVSPSIWWDDRFILKHISNRRIAPKQRFWLDIGTEEGNQAVENVRALKQILEEKGVDEKRLYYMEAQKSGHNERAWAKRVPLMLQFLYGKR